MFTFLAFLIGTTVTSPATSTSAPANTLSLRAALSSVLQGHAARARATLRGLPTTALSPDDARLRACMLSRLDTKPAPSDVSGTASSRTFELQVLNIYQRYWQVAAQDESARASAETSLLHELQRLLARPDLANIDDAEPLITARLRQEGYRTQMGRTGVLHDMMIWRWQRVRDQHVVLPEEATTTTVTYLDDFQSRGWSSYLTCDRTGTGGWTTTEGLFVIVPSYTSLSDETFRVNFLAHESQHFVDKRRFKNLPSWRLEYRAKLVELSYATKTLAPTLNAFISRQGDDSSDAHSYANKRVLDTLMHALGVSPPQALTALPAARVHAAAKGALIKDTQVLKTEESTRTSTKP